MATCDPFAASRAACRFTYGGQTTISSRSWPCTIGRKSVKNCFDCAGFLYIFQFAAMSFLRAMNESFRKDFHYNDRHQDPYHRERRVPQTNATEKDFKKQTLLTKSC